MRNGTRGTYVEDDTLLMFEQAQRDLEQRVGGHSAAGHDDYSEGELEQAHERLEELRQQHEQLERQKQELEMLRQKQERFTTGRRELSERLQRLAGSLEREMQELEEAGEVMANARQLVERDLQSVRAIAPERWSREHIHEELDAGLTVLDNAADHLDKVERRLAAVWSVVGPREAPAGLGALWSGSSWDYLRRGFFFSLPLMTLLAVLHFAGRLTD
jgi:chromosome segregation ATPase